MPNKVKIIVNKLQGEKEQTDKPKIFKNINHIYTSDTNISSTETMKSMSEYSNYIIANSSFSALAAFFSNSLDKKVIYPYPWWRESNISIQSIPINWIAIDNKL